MNLQQLRTKIDNIDRKLLELLNERARFAIEIGKQKRNLGLIIEDKQREQMVLQKLDTNNNGPLSNEEVNKIFLQIISVCKKLQQKDT